MQKYVFRVNAYVDHQDFCSPEANWPPFSALRLVKSAPGQSCSTACWNQHLVCELSYFRKINNAETFRKENLECLKTEMKEELVAPYFDLKSKTCCLQAQPLLFSCSTAAAVERLCPCRDFIKDQTALCAACL